MRLLATFRSPRRIASMPSLFYHIGFELDAILAR
jgi:hypothetical protein